MCETPEEIIADCDQQMQHILESHREELDAFLFDKNIKHPIAKAYISFALATHLSLKELE